MEKSNYAIAFAAVAALAFIIAMPGQAFAVVASSIDTPTENQVLNTNTVVVSGLANPDGSRHIDTITYDIDNGTFTGSAVFTPAGNNVNVPWNFTTPALSDGIHTVVMNVTQTNNANTIHTFVLVTRHFEVDAITPAVNDLSFETRAFVPINIQLEVVNGATFQIVSNPAHGTLLNINPSTGELQYRPDDGFAGDDGFTFQTTDGVQTSATATVSVKVIGASAHWDGAIAFVGHTSDVDFTKVPESTSGLNMYQATNGPLGFNFMDLLRSFDLKGLSTNQVTEGQFIYLLEHFDELNN